MSTIEALIKNRRRWNTSVQAEDCRITRNCIASLQAAHRIQSERIITLGKSVELERIKRNCMALYTLLDMAHDASEYISSEIRDIIKAIEEAEEINFYEMSIHQKEMDIAADKKQITVLEWQLKELRHEFQSNPELTREEIAV